MTTTADPTILTPAVSLETPMPASSVAPSASMAPGDVITREAALGASARVTISSQRLSGSIALKGARLDDLILSDYRETLDADSAQITLLSPSDTAHGYIADYGWVGNAIATPTADSVWTPSSTTLSPGRPVTLSWNNGQGLTFTRTYDLDDEYMFTVTQGVANATGAPVNLNPFGRIARWSTPEISGFYILHEGMIGVLEGTLQEVDYDDIKDDGPSNTASAGGWLGFTDKYWLTALIPAQGNTVNTRFFHTNAGGVDRYQADYLAPAMTVAPGTSATYESHLFAGAKRVELLDSYGKDMAIPLFDRAIDFGWFYFLTKPIFQALIWINEHVGNFGIGILLLTVVIKLIMFPLASKSYRAMSKMKALQPQMKELQERFKEDKPRLNQELMALYKREKANPAAGCLPILVQIPVFFALYKVLFVTIEMRHAPFFGWIQDLSAGDPTSLWNIFGLLPYDPSAFVPDMLNIGVWPILMGVTMFLQQKLNPQPTDEIQAKVFLFMPFIFTFMLAPFPAGLVIYWAWNNTLSIAQQWYIMRSMGVKIG